jgi:hypothetical protein
MDSAPRPSPAPDAECLESVLICLCVIVPGFVAGASIDALEHGLEFWGLTIPRFAVWSAFVFLVIGCSSYGGWLLASRGEAEKRISRFLLFSTTILICQFLLVPLIGFLAILTVSRMF